MDNMRVKIDPLDSSAVVECENNKKIRINQRL